MYIISFRYSMGTADGKERRKVSLFIVDVAEGDVWCQQWCFDGLVVW